MSCSPAQTAYPGFARTHRSSPAPQRAPPSPRSSSRPSVSRTPRPSGRPYSRESPPTSRPARSATISAFPSILPPLLHAYAVLPGHVDVRLQRFRRVLVEKQHVIIARPHSASLLPSIEFYGSFRLAASVWFSRKQCCPNAFEKALRNAFRWSSDASKPPSNSKSSVIRPCCAPQSWKQRYHIAEKTERLALQLAGVVGNAQRQRRDRRSLLCLTKTRSFPPCRSSKTPSAARSASDLREISRKKHAP